MNRLVADRLRDARERIERRQAALRAAVIRAQLAALRGQVPA